VTYRWEAIKANTLAQSNHIYGQLLNGARSSDIRPTIYYGCFFTSHFSFAPFLRGYVGATTRPIEHVIQDINRFCDENPGELIILDITHDFNIDKWWAPFTSMDWQYFGQSMQGIKNLWVPKDEEQRTTDITTLSISTFIKPSGKSAVIIRVDNVASLPGESDL
jgi:hypothetical protein